MPKTTETTDPWQTIARLVNWLDQQNGRSDTETALRLLKVTEEAGEAAQAWIGVTGQNPRKGITHTVTNVADELCDVITAAMVALATITADPGGHFERKIAQIAALRLDAPPATAEPCHCGRPIPVGRVAYCSDPCQWADDDHGPDCNDCNETEDAA